MCFVITRGASHSASQHAGGVLLEAGSGGQENSLEDVAEALDVWNDPFVVVLCP